MLSREEVLKIARLARLELTDAEVESYRTKLSKVLDHVRDLDKVQAPDKGFVRHVPSDVVAFREDKALPFGQPLSLLDNAPAKEASHFLLPPIREAE